LLQFSERRDYLCERLLDRAILVLGVRVHGQVAQAFERVYHQERVGKQLLRLVVGVLSVEMRKNPVLLEQGYQLEKKRHIYRLPSCRVIAPS